LALGSVVSSAIVIESQFALPGLGRVLNDAIRSNDFSVIYGVVLFVTIAVATLMVGMEFIYPLLDPRIRNE
jgi:peptide/nickel transport system permease protein